MAVPDAAQRATYRKPAAAIVRPATLTDGAGGAAELTRGLRRLLTGDVPIADTIRVDARSWSARRRARR